MAGSTFDFADTGMSPRTRRRTRVMLFLGVFLTVAAIGLAYVYSRPAEYRSGVRLEIFVPPQVAGSAAASGGEARPTFLGEVQRLTSRPLLEKALTRLGSAAPDMPETAPSDPVDALLAMLTIEPVAETRIVQLWATGPRPEALPLALGAIVDVYQEDIAQRFRADTGQAVDRAQDEATRLEAAVAAKRKQLEEFRNRYQIVSLEREENEVLSRLRGQSSALNRAEEALATAEGKRRAIKDAAAAGAPTVRSKDNPTLASLEQRVSQLREELRILEKQYTKAYLDIDPGIKEKRNRLAELEAQMIVLRRDSQSAALADADQEAASARNAVERIRQTMAADRGKVQAFAARIAEYKTMTEQLGSLEAMRRTAAEQALRLKTSERLRAPSVKLLETAALPHEPWRPLYERDAAIALGIALVTALTALLIFDYLTRREPMPTVVVAGSPPPFPTLAVNHAPQLAQSARPVAIGAGEAQVLLPAEAALPRELGESEIAALLAASDADTASTLLLLLSGPTADEALALLWEDVDPEAGTMRIGGENPRVMHLEPSLLAALTAARTRRGAQGSDAVIALGPGATARASALESVVTCAAHDAQLPEAASVTPAALRHTFVAFLVRQGIRFADLARAVGSLPSAQLTAYMGLAPAGSRRGWDEVARSLPAVAAYAAGASVAPGPSPPAS
jgi:uncharacterized protein involved in exopolysaccharide biosynthesis